VLNPQLPLQGVGLYEGSTLIAAGDIDWDTNKNAIAPHDTLTIIGGSGVAIGATGTVKLAGGSGIKNTVTFDIILPK
jgi:hypothetical protein